jgi:hypothetical protein
MCLTSTSLKSSSLLGYVMVVVSSVAYLHICV